MGRLPSWNALLAMNHWQRAKEKKKHLEEFISSLYLSENALSIPIMLALNGCSTVADASALLREMSTIKSRLKPRNAKPKKARKSTR